MEQEKSRTGTKPSHRLDMTLRAEGQVEAECARSASAMDIKRKTSHQDDMPSHASQPRYLVHREKVQPKRSTVVIEIANRARHRKDEVESPPPPPLQPARAFAPPPVRLQERRAKVSVRPANISSRRANSARRKTTGRKNNQPAVGIEPATSSSRIERNMTTPVRKSKKRPVADSQFSDCSTGLRTRDQMRRASRRAREKSSKRSKTVETSEASSGENEDHSFPVGRFELVSDASNCNDGTSTPDTSDQDGPVTGDPDSTSEAMVHLNGSASQISGGTGPLAEAGTEAQVVADEVDDDLVDLSFLDEAPDTPPRARRRLRRPVDDCGAISDEGEECEVQRIMDRVEGNGFTRYLLEWDDMTREWKDKRELTKCVQLVEAFDLYLAEHPNRDVPYLEFVSADLQAMRLIADSDKDDCALHAVKMAYELLGLPQDRLDAVEERATAFLEAMAEGDCQRFGGLKYQQLLNFLREQVPQTGVGVNLEKFERNQYRGFGTGFEAVASLAWREINPFENGVFLIHAYKASHRGHCVAMQKSGNKTYVRADGVTVGIGRHKWIRSIVFVRRLELHLLNS